MDLIFFKFYYAITIYVEIKSTYTVIFIQNTADTVYVTNSMKMANVDFALNLSFPLPKRP